MSVDTRKVVATFLAVMVVLVMSPLVGATDLSPQSRKAGEDADMKLGRRMYMEGILPSGESMSALVQGDIKVSGDQVICGTCHRRSGMGSSEGPQVIPAVTGELLYNPLRLPTSKPQLAPEIRPAYTHDMLKRAIRTGVDANGKALDPLMPRYDLSDPEMDQILMYLTTLSDSISPGVTEKEIHFATIVADTVPAKTRKALLDILAAFFQQKNVETRHETSRAANAPWHKEWLFKPYRKWRLHVWELKGSTETWSEQLQAYYRENPIFAVVSGVVAGSWKPVHDFCESEYIPCLFPTTDLPVINESDFYTIYFSKGVALEGQVIAKHLQDQDFSGKSLVQVFRTGHAKSGKAAQAFRTAALKRGLSVTDFRINTSMPEESFWSGVFDAKPEVIVAWLSSDELVSFWPLLDNYPQQVDLYLSTTVFDNKVNTVPKTVREHAYFVHPSELPSKLPRLLARSTGWFRAKRIYAPDEREIQANAYFALKMTGEALRMIRGYFFRDYFIERIEHMVDNATFTSIYPRVSLAPEQRFVAKGGFIANISDDDQGRLMPISDWIIP